MTDARRLGTMLTVAAVACLLALACWPGIPHVSRADMLRDRLFLGVVR